MSAIQISEFKKYANVSIAIARKNISLRYKNSIFGFLWGLITPFVYILIFVVVFSRLVRMPDYPVYIISGIIFWTYFVSSVTQIIRSILDNAQILKSISVPTLVFPAAAILATLVNFLLSFIPYFIIMLFLGYSPGWELLGLIPLIVLFSIFIFGVSIILCALNIYFRDVEIIWQTVTPLLFYSTPIAYSIDAVATNYAWLLHLNPLTVYLTPARSILYHQVWPDGMQWLLAFGLATLSLLMGLSIYLRLKRGFYTNL